MNALVHLLFFVSGVAGLIYEVIWVRQFGTLFGSTVYSAALVTGIFMCGLGVGGYLAGRLADARFRDDAVSPLVWYGRFELAIAGLALLAMFALPALAVLSSNVSGYVAGDHGWYELTAGSSLFRYSIAIVLMAPITVLMGGTLTLLIRFVVASELASAGWRIGLLYAINTAGAALGCVLTDTALVPLFGLQQSQLLAVSLNVLAGVGALALVRRAAQSGPSPARRVERTEDAVADSSAARFDRQVTSTGLAIALTGLASMGMQVVWFRHLSSILGGYRPVFSMLLTVILVGTWVGSILGGYAHRRLGRPAGLYALAQALFAVATLAVLASFGRGELLGTGDAFWQTLDGESDQVFRLARYAATLRAALLVAGLPALLMGFSFPLANANIQNVEARVGRRAGWLYLANSLGGVLGSFIGGFVLLPLFGTQVSVVLLVGVAALSIVPLQLGGRASAFAPGSERRSKAPFLLAYAVALIAIVSWRALPADYLLQQTMPGWMGAANMDLVATSEGVNENIAILRERSEPPLWSRLMTNGTSMSGTHTRGRRYMHAFVHLPLVRAEPTETAMVMCFGCGNTLRAALMHPSMRDVHVVDLSRHVLEQAAYFDAEQLLEDPRVTVYVNDARDHLRMQPEESFDLITGEPPPIAYAGVVNLYTREFFELARSRLTARGAITYWLPVDQVSQPVARSIVRAFLDVFPGAVLLSGYREQLILMGTKEGEPSIGPERIAALARSADLRLDLRRIYLENPVELIGTFVTGADALGRATEGVEALSDDRPSMEYGSTSYTRYTGPPPDFFTFEGLERWCPGCFDGGLSAEELGELRAYLGVMGAYYESDLFKSSNQGTGFRLRRSPEVDPVVQRSAYVRSLMVGMPPGYDSALIWMARGEPARAIAILQDLAAREPENVHVRIALADAWLALDESARAIAELEEALRLAPGYSVAQGLLDVARRAPAGR